MQELRQRLPNQRALRNIDLTKAMHLDRLCVHAGVGANGRLEAFAEAKALGKQTFGLVSVDRAAKSGQLNGQKVEARGLLYRDGAYADLNLTSLRTLAQACSN